MPSSCCLNQHRRVEALLRAIEHAGADERRQAFADAADELALHIGAEEAVFYPRGEPASAPANRPSRRLERQMSPALRAACPGVSRLTAG